MIYWLPLEDYKERYTTSWNRPKTGWIERDWLQTGVQFKRVEGDPELKKEAPIRTGVALDSFRRCKYAMSQVMELLGYIEKGEVKENDIIYFDDFWHPGMESLPYVFNQLGYFPRVFCFCHAQSVDVYDFTYPMRDWMRYYEKGQAEWIRGIFVNCPVLKNLLIDAGIGTEDTVYVTGHVFSTEEVMERMPVPYQNMMKGKGKEIKRENKVVFSSRWDKEKNPQFFLQVGREVIKQLPDVKFVVCTSASKLRSNMSNMIEELHNHIREYPNNFFLKENLTKEQYYAELASAKIQFNCSDQDFVSYVLLEGNVAGCYPIYPAFRSFPSVLSFNNDYLYDRLDCGSAVTKIVDVFSQKDLWSRARINNRSWISKRHDHTPLRMLNRMGLITYAKENPYEYTVSRSYTARRRAPKTKDDTKPTAILKAL